MIALRLIHIFSGVFWVGVSFFNIQYLQPSVRATGANGQKLMQHLTQRTRFLNAVYGSATLSMLSGLLMYGILFGFRPAAMLKPYGLVLGIGGLAGVIAWLVVIFVIRDIFRQMGSMSRAIQAQGGPPNPEQVQQLGALSVRLGNLGRWGLVLLTIALVGMSVAQYVSF